MHDFGDIVYLDTPKTGSTFVSSFLNECCLLPQREFSKHKQLHGTYRPDAFHFITTRHPFELYLSLYRYGCDRKGAIFELLDITGNTDVYVPSMENFERWIEMMMDAETFHVLEKYYFEGGYELFAKAGIGLMSFRFLRLAVPEPLVFLGNFLKRSEIQKLYHEHSIADMIIRHDGLEAGLRELAFQRFPQHFDLDKADAFLTRSDRVNPSRSKVVDYFKASPIARAMVQQKETFLLDLAFAD